MAALSAHDKAILNCVFNPNLPIEEANSEQSSEIPDEEETSEEALITKPMEIEAIKLAESGHLQEGLAILNDAIKMAPKRPSLYNNRALVNQYLRQFEDAFRDLTTAIDLCDDAHKKTLRQAYCQRGILHKRAKRIESAKQDFEKAARLGSAFSKSQLVLLNPYAALCNQMLRQVMDKLNY